MLVLVTLFSDCSPASEKNAESLADEIKEDLSETKEVYIEKYEDFKKEAERKIAENEIKINALKDQIKSENKKTKANVEKNLKDLEAKNQLFKDKLNNFKDEGEAKWETFKIEFNQDMDNLGQALKDFSENNIK
jgi:molybdopterin converting factor small subunit